MNKRGALRTMLGPAVNTGRGAATSKLPGHAPATAPAPSVGGQGQKRELWPLVAGVTVIAASIHAGVS
jgi:hypothetical protein